MFGIGGTEIFLIALFALLIFGPDKLPEFAKTFGRFVREFKRYQASMESTIRAEIERTDGSGKDAGAGSASEALPAAPTASTVAYEGDEDDEEEEE